MLAGPLRRGCSHTFRRMTTDAVEALSRDELVARVRALELEVGKRARGANGSADKVAVAAAAPASAYKGLAPIANGSVQHALPSEQTVGTPRKTKKVPRRIIPFAEQPVRKIALLMTYEGWHFSGLAIQPPSIPQPTVEGLLLAALIKTRLIDETTGWETCGFSRCGRTDRGVSSAGQVLTLWVRSKRRPGDGGQPLGDDWQPDSRGAVECDERARGVDRRIPRRPLASEATDRPPRAPPTPDDPLEFAYPYLLNRVLPPTIRILAWAPLLDHPAFHARFSCQSRHYKYFFARSPIAGRPPLDLAAMQAAADNLMGEHDYRNFCKVDGSKQIENHKREVVRATVAETATAGECVFELVGTAFLWHQVRHIIAILFLVGTGLESPSVVTQLLHTSHKPVPSLPFDQVVDGKPGYQMAAALPLQLYRCDYEPDQIDWRYGGYDGPYQSLPEDEQATVDATTHSAVLGLLQGLQNQAVDARLKAQHIQTFYDVAAGIHHAAVARSRTPDGGATTGPRIEPSLHTTGAGETASTRNYIPVVERERLETPNEINKRWRGRFGKRQATAEGAALEREGVELDLE